MRCSIALVTLALAALLQGCMTLLVATRATQVTETDVLYSVDSAGRAPAGPLLIGIHAGMAGNSTPRSYLLSISAAELDAAFKFAHRPGLPVSEYPIPRAALQAGESGDPPGRYAERTSIPIVHPRTALGDALEGVRLEGVPGADLTVFGPAGVEEGRSPGAFRFAIARRDPLSGEVRFVHFVLAPDRSSGDSGQPPWVLWLLAAAIDVVFLCAITA